MPTSCSDANDCQNCLVRNPTQPPDDLEWVTEDRVFLKLMVLEDEGMIVPQHSHAYDHTSLVLQGTIHVLADGKSLGIFEAPAPINIKAGVKHTFTSLESDTHVLCIHRLEAKEVYPSIIDEHHLVD